MAQTGDYGGAARGPFLRRRVRYEETIGDDVAGVEHNGHGAWENRTRVVLTPVAAPSILGLYGFMGATLIVAANLAGWYGGTRSPEFLFPFALTFGGIAQFLAGMWSYRARDGLATAMHGTWGAFWIGYGVLWGFAAAGAYTLPAVKFPELGFWFVVLAAITWAGAAASMFENLALCGVLTTLAAGSTLAAIGFMTGTLGIERAAGWVFAFSAFIAWYTATAMMLEGTLRRPVLPVGKRRDAGPAPRHVALDPLEYPSGMPGVRVGQ
jgi:uncharacterized protein